MEQLRQIINEKCIDIHKVYKSLSELCDENKEFEEIIPKLWDLIGRNVLSKDIVYLSLLVNRNFELLTKCIVWDKKIFKIVINNYCSLFDYTNYFQKHWFYEVVNNANLFTKDTFKKTVQDKITFLQIINLINNSSAADADLYWLENKINTINVQGLGTFWGYYLEEIKYLINIVKFCLNYDTTKGTLEILYFTVDKSSLETISEYLNICQNGNEIKTFFMHILSSQSLISEDLQTQLNTFSSYSILCSLLKLTTGDEEALKKSNINETINSIPRELIEIKEPSRQIDLLEIIFVTIFMKKCDLNTAPPCGEDSRTPSTFICNQKEVRLILFVLKAVIDKVWLQKIYPVGSQEHKRLDHLRKIIIDATWRLEIIENLKSYAKCDINLLYYMLADPEGLINICIKKGDFSRASEVLKIYNLTESKLARIVYYADKLEELKTTLKKHSKSGTLSEDISVVKNFSYTKPLEEFLQHTTTFADEEADEIIAGNPDYPFLVDYLSKNNIFLDIFDLAITHATLSFESAALLELASQQNMLSDSDSSIALYIKSVRTVYDDVRVGTRLSLLHMLLDPGYLLDLNQYRAREKFYFELEVLYTEFLITLGKVEEGVLNKNHDSHRVLSNLIKHCGGDSDKVRYLQKLFTYLKSFSKVLYIEADSSNIISRNKNTSFFELLSHNRSELMGKLLFQKNLDPNEFEKYFKKMKLDFLYHVAGNCFPTINLHADENINEDELYHENILYTPNKGVIYYILKRNRLLALLLNEMYHVEGVEIDMSEIRIQNFLNFLRLPRIKHLKMLYMNSDILTALQNNISFRKMKEFIAKEMSKNECPSSPTSPQTLEAAAEVSEGGVTTIWKRLADMLNSVPETQLKRETRFDALRDELLTRVIEEGFDCEYYRNVIDIKNRESRVNLMIDNMKIWPVEFCIKCIKHEISLFGGEKDDKTEELKCWLKHLENSKLVMDALGILSWGDLYKKCAFTPVPFVKTLLFAKKINALIEFIGLNSPSNDTLLCVDEKFLLKAFELETCPESMRILLNTLPKAHCVTVCNCLLRTLKNVKHLQFIVDCLSVIAPDKYLHNMMISLKILSLFSPGENLQALLALLHDPLSIIEVLIMNTKLDSLAEVLNVIKPLIPSRESEKRAACIENIDYLIRQYAGKCLDFRVISQSPQAMTSERITQEFINTNSELSQKGFLMPDIIPTKQQWIQNSEVTECMCCSNVSFSMFNRRHHCRRCGRVICSSCSKKRMIVPNYEDILVRVCLDCFNQTFKDQTTSEDNKSSWSVVDDFWMLTTDPEHNRIVREEFSYEFAPSVSLCLSLMKFHSNGEPYCQFLLDQCKVLLKMLAPNKELAREIDYLLVIRMIKSLGVAVKMASQDAFHYKLSPVDMILNRAAILELLAENGCLHLLPPNEDIYSLSLRRLADKLVEMEHWNLALNVAAKGGLDNTVIFVAWGKSCLKAGCFMLAREKFSKCITRNSREFKHVELHNIILKVTKDSPLLKDIIKILESKTESLYEEVTNLVDSQKLTASTNTLNQSCCTSFGQSQGAMFIMNKIKQLKEIERGVYRNDHKGKRINNKTGRPFIEPVIYEECVHYLTKYGSVISLIHFHLKYKQYRKILDYIIQRRVDPEVFNYVYVKCLRQGNVVEFQTHLSQTDSSLIIWQDYLRKLCHHLEKQNFLNSLYQLQKYMGDYIRAAMTCVRFYEANAASFSDLFRNKVFLDKSEQHLTEALEQEQWVDVSPVEVAESRTSFEEKSITNPMLIKKMTYEDIEKNTHIIKMQNEVAAFLSNCELRGVFPMQIYRNIVPNSGNLPKEDLKVLTLFGSSSDKKYAAVFCIICGETVPEGFPLALRIITHFKLNPRSVYNEAGKYLAVEEKFGSIAELISRIRKSCDTDATLGNDLCDEMLLHAVISVVKNGGSEVNVESLIRLIIDKAVKISAYIESKQLKTAFFLATKHKRIIDIRRILKEAESLNQPNIRVLCRKALQKYSQSNTLAESDTT